MTDKQQQSKKIYLGFEIIENLEDKQAPKSSNVNMDEYEDEDDNIGLPKDEEDDDVEVLHKNIPTIYCISFSQTNKTVGIGTVDGLRIQSTTEKKVKYVLEGDKNIFKRGVKLISLLYDTFLCAIVTDNKQKEFPDTKVYILDAVKQKIISEYEFNYQITSISYMREYLIVSTIQTIILYDIVNKVPLRCILDSSKGIQYVTSSNYNTFTFAYLQDSSCNLIVWNVWKKMPVVIDIRQDFIYNTNNAVVDDKSTQYYQDDIANIVLNQDGTLLAMAEKGGIRIKIFDATNGKLKCTLYRGKIAKLITDMQFNKSNTVLGLISTSNDIRLDEGTVHLFDISFIHQSNMTSSYSYVNKMNNNNYNNYNNANMNNNQRQQQYSNIKSQQFNFNILKRYSNSLKDNSNNGSSNNTNKRQIGPFIIFHPTENQFTIYSDSDYTITQQYQLEIYKPKQRITDNLKLDGWIEDIVEH